MTDTDPLDQDDARPPRPATHPAPHEPHGGSPGSKPEPGDGSPEEKTMREPD
jgi:hypothetical protein